MKLKMHGPEELRRKTKAEKEKSFYGYLEERAVMRF